MSLDPGVVNPLRRPFLHDQYAALSHKEYLGGGSSNVRPIGTQSWVADEDARRLAAYEILAAYMDNVVRYYLPVIENDSSETWKKLREYGHASLLVQQARALLLGRTQEITVPDAQGVDEDDDGPAADDVEKDASVTGPDIKTPEPNVDRERAQVFADWLDQWAQDEHLTLKLLEAEETIVGEGDGVYVLGWDTARDRPRLRVYDPGFYFPDLSEDDSDDDTDMYGHTAAATDDEYPRAVHIAYEFLGRDGRAKLRRYTWELLPPDQALENVAAPAAMPWEDTPNPNGLTCLYSDRTYDVSRLAGQRIYNITAAPESARANRLDLRIDFLPVVHVPNDAAGSRHFGRSLLTRIAQILDDLADADTDLNANATLVGSTPTVTVGAGAVTPAAGPGGVTNLPAGSSMAMLDTSKNLDALLKYVAHLFDVLSTNSRVASALLGVVNPEKVPSGYALELGFAPTVALIDEMRAVRKIKYGLLLKFAMRMAQAYKVLPAGPTPEAYIELGTFLPSDRIFAIDLVQKLLPAHAISIETAVLILRNAGLPIDDVHAEIERIQHEAFEQAIALADATGDDAVVRQRLGLPPKEEPPVAPPGAVPPGTPPGTVPAPTDPAAPPPTPRPIPPRSLNKQ